MPFFNAPAAIAALSADGNAEGFVTVADATPFYPGARVWLIGTATASKEYMITDIATGNKIGLREVLAMNGGAKYGRTPVTQWTVADGAKICQDPQVVDVEINNIQKVSKL